MSKQTAVEWLVRELNQKIDFIPMDKWDMIRDTIEQAKAMEREQLREIYLKGIENYDSTFKRKEQ
jgi:excinuclease UvrABC helicase subunit UvrB